MSIAYDSPTPGAITLTDDSDTSRTQVIPSGTTTQGVNDAIAAFFANSAPPPLTRADIYQMLATALSVSLEDMTAFFDGSMN